jgi:hypothetical protein
LLRFWLIRMNSERKIDSSETIVDKSWKGNGSKANLLLDSLFSQSQMKNHTAWKTMNHIFPACEAMTSPIRADRDEKWVRALLEGVWTRVSATLHESQQTSRPSLIDS